MDAKEYLTERKRMCDGLQDDYAKGKLTDILSVEMVEPDQAIAVVSEWSKAHPRISYVEEIFGMYID